MWHPERSVSRECEYIGWCEGGVGMERLLVLDSPGLRGLLGSWTLSSLFGGGSGCFNHGSSTGRCVLWRDNSGSGTLMTVSRERIGAGEASSRLSQKSNYINVKTGISAK